MTRVNKKLNVVVLMGGPSQEHEVSLNTGKMVTAALDKKKYDIKPIIITKEGNWLLPKDSIRLLAEKNENLSIKDSGLIKKGGSFIDEIKSRKGVDVVFLALHGTYGEDGAIQGLLELAEIPYTGSGILASALGMDKEMTKKILKREKIPTPNHVIFAKNNHVSLKKVKFPCVVKPVAQGSSVGVSIVKGPGQLKKAIKNALFFGPHVMIEDFIEGREITAAVIGNQKPRALPLIEIKPKLSSFYDYESKYADGGSEHICPAQIPSAVAKRIQDLALRVHATLGCRGATRTDFILHGSQPYVLEINTLPGMTSVSLAPQAAEAAGIKFPAFLDKLIELALEKE